MQLLLICVLVEFVIVDAGIVLQMVLFVEFFQGEELLQGERSDHAAGAMGVVDLRSIYDRAHIIILRILQLLFEVDLALILSKKSWIVVICHFLVGQEVLDLEALLPVLVDFARELWLVLSLDLVRGAKVVDGPEILIE